MKALGDSRPGLRVRTGAGCRMAVDAEIKRSFFTQQLANMLEEEGIATPPYILDLLDKPIVRFTAEDKKLYESQVKDKQLLLLFARLLLKIYQASGESARHSWRGMCHLLKDSPIKVCVTYVIKQDEERKGPETRAAPARDARTAAPPRAPQEGAEAGAREASRKSYYTKKLERKLDERGIKVPASIVALLDKPFGEFSAEDQRLYEAEFKGRQLTILFSDLLDELYEETGRCESGWSAMCRFLKDTPMKLIATYVVQEEERLARVARESTPLEPPPGAQPVREKYEVKPYRPAPAPEKETRRRRRF